ncbi:hypothetical protein D0817_14915 [Flavobacterium cupreum]|uniref:Uncharacterized protein n=1 Tax=Flavobacterium cupreum TaxID=2133766 RepID=A0A434A673_9FLAO|nr:hypothetical protein [Flavobacterium cupreum]RUT69903.1 hypothetical protein D0817_14915 [Flavobacterium cupreum]
MKNKIYATIVISFFVFLVFMIVRSYYINYQIENHGQIIISKYVSYKSFSKSQENYFIYYINDKRVKNYASDNDSDFRQNIGKFYKIKYLSKYPDIIHPIYEEEVTDTTEILEAGFSKEDL